MSAKEGKHPGAGSGVNAYKYEYFMNKFRITDAEVRMALREIRFGTPKELEDYLILKYK